jgi:hypothetical protein
VDYFHSKASGVLLLNEFVFKEHAVVNHDNPQDPR